MSNKCVNPHRDAWGMLQTYFQCMLNCVCFKSYSTGSDTLESTILATLKNREAVIHLSLFFSIPFLNYKRMQNKTQNCHWPYLIFVQE